MIGLLIAVLGAAPVAAHAQLVSTSPSEGEVLPQAPEQISFDFDEPVTVVDDSVRLFVGGNDPVILDSTVTGTTLKAPLPSRGRGLPDGGYAVSYRVISADNHPVSGAVTFSVGIGTAAPVLASEEDRAATAVVSILTALQYLGLLVFAGLVLFSVFVLGYRAQLTPRLQKAAGVAGLVAIISTFLLIPGIAITTVGGGLSTLTNIGAWVGGISVAAVLAAVVILAAVVSVKVVAASRPSRVKRVLAVGAALLGLSTPALNGHTQVMKPRSLIIAADLGHLWAAAIWIGGIIGLVVLLGATRRASTGEIADTAQAIVRFSRLAGWSVLLLVVSGVVMALIILDDFAPLVGSAWGWVLLMKIALLLPVLGVSAYNRFRLVPALETHCAPQSRWAVLTRTLVVEAVVLSVIITATGFLTNLEPRSTATQSTRAGASSLVEFTGQGQGMEVTGEISPGIIGKNTVAFFLDHQGSPVDTDDVTLTATLPAQNLGPLDFKPEKDPVTGGYSAAMHLPVAGEWSFQVGARVSTFSEPLVTVVGTIK